MLESVEFYFMLLEYFNDPTEAKENEFIPPLRNISFIFSVVSRLTLQKQ